MHPLARLDQQYVWHPFTQMRDWLKGEPVVIQSGQGAVLRDVHGRTYLDGNASIWTNLHGHNHPRINRALERQLKKIAHSSALGLANEPASLLAAALVQVANPPRATSGRRPRTRTGCPSPKVRKREGDLGKVFFSDDGSTALEVALKLAYEYARRTGQSRSPKFLSLQGAYHGDTIGAVSLGHIDLFHRAYSGLLFKSDTVMAPYCYRCPFNRAHPERADARLYRRCRWECVGKVEEAFARQRKRGHPYAAVVLEPLIQGAAGMIPQPSGWLRRVEAIVRSHKALLVADEVLTGFGRAIGCDDAARPPSAAVLSGSGNARGRRPRGGAQSERFFACHQEGVQPDFLALAKGLTGGYLPMAATLTTAPVFEAFLGGYEEFKTFFHGHSYTGNQLGAAAALASLQVLQSRASQRARNTLEQALRHALPRLWGMPQVGDIRQVGLIVGVELVRDWRTREPFVPADQAGLRVCAAMKQHGVLTRPVGNVVVLMPPFCTTPEQAEQMVEALRAGVRATFPRTG